MKPIFLLAILVPLTAAADKPWKSRSWKPKVAADAPKKVGDGTDYYVTVPKGVVNRTFTQRDWDALEDNWGNTQLIRLWKQKHEAGFQTMNNRARVRRTTGNGQKLSPFDAATLQDGCVGLIDKQADFAIEINDELEFARFFAHQPQYGETRTDLTMVVEMPNADLVCIDDKYGTDPGIEWANPKTGLYHVWIGAAKLPVSYDFVATTNRSIVPKPDGPPQAEPERTTSTPSNNNGRHQAFVRCSAKAKAAGGTKGNSMVLAKCMRDAGY